MKPLSNVARNVLANFAGRGWAGVISLVFVPLYLKFLGIESYGLIGIYMSLVALLAVLDLGLSSTFNRELARLSAHAGTGQEARDLTRTLEVVYGAIGLAAGVVLVLLAPVIARSWVTAKGLPADVVTKAVMLMGCVAALEWPSALYGGGLMGLQRQVLFNGIRAAMATVQAGGAVLILWLVSPTILAYFLWQAVTAFSQMLLLHRALRTSLPETGTPAVFRKALLQKNWRFAAGMTGISVMATLLTQADKIFLSKFLPLEAFGYYVLAFNVANALSYLVAPIFGALFPKFCQIVAENKEAEAVSLYHKTCQFLSVVVLPAAVTLAFFSEEVLVLWIGNPVTVAQTHRLLSLLVVGTMLNAIMTPPYMVQLAYGWTKLSFVKNIVAVAVLIPLLPWMVIRFGPAGAAFVWIILNAGYCLIEIPIMHGRILKDEMAKWYVVDVGLPLFLAICTSLVSRLVLPVHASSTGLLFWIVSTAGFGLLLSACPLPGVREWMRRSMAK